MLFRDENGKLININRLEFNDDKKYYSYLINFIKNEKVKINSFIITNTLQYNILKNHLS